MVERRNLTKEILEEGYKPSENEDTRINEIVDLLKRECPVGAIMIFYRKDEIGFAQLRLSTQLRNEALADALSRGDIAPENINEII